MKVVAMLERSAGNAETGTAWVETAIFDDQSPLRDVLNWASRRLQIGEPTRQGRLMIDIPDMRTG